MPVASSRIRVATSATGIVGRPAAAPPDRMSVPSTTWVGVCPRLRTSLVAASRLPARTVPLTTWPLASMASYAKDFMSDQPPKSSTSWVARRTSSGVVSPSIAFLIPSSRIDTKSSPRWAFSPIVEVPSEMAVRRAGWTRISS